MMHPAFRDRLGRIGYDSWRKSAAVTALVGNANPPWESLREDEREEWRSIGVEIRGATWASPEQQGDK